MTTGFFWDERCFWHAGGNYAYTLPLGGLIQPLAAGGLPENPETKRRLKNLIEVTGLINDLAPSSAEMANWDDLLRVHPETYLQEFKSLSDQSGGELGPCAPFASGGFEHAALSAGLAKEALFSVLNGEHKNAYALSRPPGHHCLPDQPNGFCLLANIAISVEAALAEGHCQRVAVVDWDVHHGNGTEAIFYERDDVLTISLHQEYNYPIDSGDSVDRGSGPGEGTNMNIPLPPGSGHSTYVEAIERLVLPALNQFRPDVIIVACGYDAAAIDPLGRMVATAATFGEMTKLLRQSADDLCEGRLVMVHEGGYSEVYVPFCGHAVLATLSDSKIDAPDPLAKALATRQPQQDFQAFLSSKIDEMEDLFFR